ncbi:MAG: lamin tail domain-containing protein [Myxococcales bacterium]|nr:MAG: lamin tail domain-containing protein [Myxococcales bacterium]
MKQLCPILCLCAATNGCVSTDGFGDTDSGKSETAQPTIQSWPAAAATNVAPNLSLLAVQAVDYAELESSFALALIDRETKEQWPLLARKTSCQAIGWQTGYCIAAKPAEPLKKEHAYEIQLIPKTLAKVSGSSLWTSAFTTGSQNDATAPTLQQPDCMLDEAALLGACLLRQDTRLSLRTKSSEATRLWLKTGEVTQTAIANNDAATLVLEKLEPNTAIMATLFAADAADNLSFQRLELRTSERLASVTISRVMANPSTAEPTQEFVELYNFGNESIDIAGFSLTDDPYEAGDTLSEGPMLSPGARVLITPRSFQSSAAAIPIPTGIPLFRVDESVARGGLKNSGETLYLRDRQGQRLSATPAVEHPKQDGCLVRSTADTRSEATQYFYPRPEFPCRPGKAPDNSQ